MAPMSEPAPPAQEWVPTYPAIRRVDEAWFKAERLTCGVMFVVMALMVFASVITEVFGNRREWIDVAGLLLVCVVGVRTRAIKEGERRPSWPASLGLAAAVTVVIAGAVWAYTERYPGGFIWAQKLALVMMIWVSLLGASMATYDRSHLALEMGEKLWPAAALRWVKAVAHGVTSAFCVAALAVSIHLVLQQRHEGHTIVAVEWLPTWVAFLAMPYAFASMALRFAAQMVTTAADQAAPAEEHLPT